MAVTAHYMAKGPDGNERMVSKLVAFRLVTGTHSGANIAKVFLKILKELNVLHKVIFYLIIRDVRSP